MIAGTAYAGGLDVHVRHRIAELGVQPPMLAGRHGFGKEPGVLVGQMPLRFLQVLDQPFASPGAERRGGRFDRVPGHRSRGPHPFLGLQADPGHMAERLT